MLDKGNRSTVRMNDSNGGIAGEKDEPPLRHFQRDHKWEFEAGLGFQATPL